MPKVTFDTNIFISRKPTELPASFYFSVIVLQELVAGAEDDSAIRSFDAARREYEKAERLLVPNSEDWLLAGKVINSLQRGLKSRAQGLTPKMSVDEKYRIISDVLIARTARRAGVTIVTDNTKDFEKIQKFCNVRLMSGIEYFGYEPTNKTAPRTSGRCFRFVAVSYSYQRLLDLSARNHCTWPHSSHTSILQSEPAIG